MLSALLLAALVTAPLATFLLFVRASTGRGRGGAWAWWGRAASAVFGTAALAAARERVLDEYLAPCFLTRYLQIAEAVTQDTDR